MNTATEEEVIREITAAIAIILAVLRRVAKGASRITTEEQAAFICFRNACAKQRHRRHRQDDIYGAIGLALLKTKYARKRKLLARDIDAFLRSKQRRIGLVAAFVPVFSQAKKEIATLKGAY
ncbi:MAG: hypothetical protein A3E38_01260 [Candidatus Moranbacteria bacterium RIFCSPHIGHO2_12_FULL_54_9]|nr:MAG: hypothetical protein A2878_03405 [Candidatus Moranbacteria bacterium RIFCSPHIGHO2_01_FULL_54_31]OGI24818.1 MAG: hypothetical protein A3E38_01260 [Candidatus Moranbacteria bacterium RIFCSPHIGHO2_12_FULL_54_9]